MSEKPETVSLENILLTPLPDRMDPEFARGRASQYREKMLGELGLIGAGEEDAFTMITMLYLMGAENASIGALLGVPGTLKSATMNNVHRPIRGLEGKVAHIEHRIDLTPADVVGKGGKMSVIRRVDGQVTEEELISRIKGVIGSDTSVLLFDEGNRHQPAVYNALLKVLQDGKGIEIEENGESKTADNIDLALLAMNYFGTKFTEGFDPAMARRVGFASEVGRHQPHELSVGAQAVLDNPNRLYYRSPDISEVILLSNLRLLRGYVELQPIEKPYTELAGIATQVMRDAFYGYELALGDASLVSQLLRGAQAFSLMHNRKSVLEPDLAAVTEMMITAKLGLSGKVGAIPKESTVETAAEPKGFWERHRAKEKARKRAEEDNWLDTEVHSTKTLEEAVAEVIHAIHVARLKPVSTQPMAVTRSAGLSRPSKISGKK